MTALLGSLVALATPAQAHPGHGDETFKALVFSKTAGFRHSSIPTGVAAIRQLGTDNGFTVDATEDAAAFTDANLAQYEVVIFLSTTGDVLNAEQQGAFERYIQAGGGYAGVHAASDTEYDWPWYGELVGAYFRGHPANQTATVKVTDEVHPATEHLPLAWSRFDEWYSFRDDPTADVHVIAELDESTYNPGGNAMGANHPIAWCQDIDGGRSWYTGMGHTEESFAEPAFLEHLLGGIQTAAGVVDADCTATDSGSYEKVTLDDNTANPMELAIAEDGRVFYVDRNGTVKIVKTDGTVVTAGSVGVYTGQEFGLLGIALDPDFSTNNQIYLYYSPSGARAVDRVSRFTMSGDSITAGSEVTVLEIDVQRAECCHAGGSMEFDNDGNLYIATGDNTNPFNSDGYSPIDERSGRSAWDAQRSSANTNTLNGKILRITPQDDGSYTVPAGNLFAPGTDKTRPEIYAMGFRNPFRIGLDPLTNKLQVADYGPDAGSANATRGPDGRVEWNLLNEPGFYGWPYCVGANTPYKDFDFATSTSGADFNCAAPVNNSPNNTGLTQLPAAIGTPIWQGKSSTGNPEIGGSGAPMAGGTYRFDPELDSERKWPAYWDGKAIWGDWNDSRLFSLQLSEDGSSVFDITRMLPGLSFNRPHALQFGPDGALYMIEWGSGFGGNNADSGIYRIDYISGNRTPIAAAAATPTSGAAPLTVAFDSTGSRDPDGSPITYAWDFDGDGTADSTEANPTHVYTTAGNFTARLTVTDADGKTATSNLDITVGNTAPVVTIEVPVDGGFFDFGDQVAYRVTVQDAEDGTIDCNNVVVQPALGHDEHAHGYEQYRGCEGLALMSGDEGHIGANIFGVLSAKYTDKGAPGVGPLTSETIAVLQPKHKEAEYYVETGRVAGGAGADTPGVQVENTTDTGGGQNIGYITDGDWFSYDPANLLNIDQVRLRVASASVGGTVELRLDAPDGPVVATATVPPTGGWQNWQTVTADIADSVPAHSKLYFVSRRPAGNTSTDSLLNVNWVEFAGAGVTDNQRPVVTASATPVSGSTPLNVSFTASATDPDGNLPITYAWVFGDGTTGTGATPSHTYTTAGTFTARVTATDSKGASSTATVQITAQEFVSDCLGPKSDAFDGTALDRTRWTTVLNENQDLRVADGALVIPTSRTDIYGTGNTPVANVVLQDLPTGAFEATAKLTLPARRAYQQAGLIIYGDDDNYAKMVLQGRADGADDAGARIFQFIREEAGTPNEVGESNTANLGAAYPDTVWVRFTSDGSNLRAAYSADGQTFTLMPQTKSLAGIQHPKIGLVSLAATGDTRPIIDAKFDQFRLTPDALPEVTPNDEFDGTSASTCRWQIVRPDTAAYGVANGQLRIDTSNGDIYGAATGTPGNFFLQGAPAGDWTIQTKVDGTAFDGQYHQGGLIVYVDDKNYVKLDTITTNAAGSPVARGIEMRSEVNDVVGNPQPAVNNLSSGVWHLRLTKAGNTYSGFYSADGENWTSIGESVTNAAVASGRVGLFTLRNNAPTAKPALFDYFRVVGDEPEPGDTTAPTVRVATAPVAPASGWNTGDVTVTATATDDQPGQVYTEYRTGDGPWAEYTAPVVITAEGTTAVSFRASDTAGNTSAAEVVTVKIDRTAPTVTAAPDREPTATGWWNGPVTVTAAAADAGSGAGPVEYRVNGGAWTAYTGPVAFSTEGTSVVGFRAADVAGNTSAETTLVVKVDATAPVLTATTDRQPNAAGWWTRPVAVSASATDAGGSGGVTVQYRLDGGGWLAYTGPVTFSTDGARTLVLRAVDSAGNASAEKTVEVKIDRVAPAVALSVDRPANGAGWHNRKVTVTAEGVDAVSGGVQIQYQVGNGGWNVYRDGVQLSAQGTHVLKFRGTDAAGNTSLTVQTTIKIDTVAPETAVKKGNSNAKVSLNAKDATSGVAKTQYRVNDGAWQVYQGGDIQVQPNGKTRLEYRSTDKAGNVEAIGVYTTPKTGASPNTPRPC